jgi:hypothetical protein
LSELYQHSACDDSLIDELERAKSSEYSDLFDELESIGYRLEVCDHLTYEMQENRKQQLLNGA